MDRRELASLLEQCGSLEHPAHSADYRLAACTVRLHCSAPELFQEIHGVLSPTFGGERAAELPAGGWRFAVMVSDAWDFERFAQAAEGETVMAQSIGYRTLRGKVLEDATVRYVANAESGNLIAVDNVRKLAAAIGRKPDSSLILDASATIRNILRSELERRGGFVLHSSSLRVKDKGVAIIGEKGAGKSTLLMEWLMNAGAACVGPDRTFFWKDGQGIRFSGWPSEIRLKAETVAEYPGLQAFVHQDPALWNGEKYEIPLQRLSSWHVPVAREVPLHVVIFKQYVPDMPDFQVEPLHRREDMIRELKSSLYTPEDPNYPNWIGVPNQSEEKAEDTLLHTPGLRFIKLTGGGSRERLLNLAQELVFDEAYEQRTYYP